MGKPCIWSEIPLKTIPEARRPVRYVKVKRKTKPPWKRPLHKLCLIFETLKFIVFMLKVVCMLFGLTLECGPLQCHPTGCCFLECGPLQC